MMVSYTDTEYTGTLVAYGGASDYSYGGAGTIYKVVNNAKKILVVDNGEKYTVKVRKIWMKLHSLIRDRKTDGLMEMMGGWVDGWMNRHRQTLISFMNFI